MGVWYKENLNKVSSVISSRIRLARNVAGIPFPQKMNDAQKTELLQKFKEIFDGARVERVGTLKYFDLESIPKEELFAMVERHTISPDFANANGKRGLVISEDESVSIMLLEEDHVRIQVLLGGENLESAYEIAKSTETLLAKEITLAFNKELGYLTGCPTNLGTGLRASVMLHLPLLEKAGALSELGSSVSKIGLTVRGMYGEKSKAEAALYQLSNQVTLGISEETAIENLIAITAQIAAKEQALLKEIKKIDLEDLVFRALGTLSYARKISSSEMMKSISLIRLGQFAGIVDFKEQNLPIQLLIETKPAFLQKNHGRMNSEDRDVLRAKLIREALSGQIK